MKKSGQTIIKADEFYTITGISGRVIEGVEGGMNGDAVVLGNYHHHPNQEWSFVRMGEGMYQVKNRATGRMMDLVSGGSSDGTWIHQWDDVSCSSQIWMVEPTNDGYIKLKTQLSLDKCVDVVGMSTEVGARLQVWQDVNGENQTWVLAPVTEKATRTKKAPAKAAPKKPATRKTTAAKKNTTAKATTKPVAEDQAVAEKAAAPKKPATRKMAAPKTTKAPAKKPAAKTTSKKTATAQVAEEK